MEVLDRNKWTNVVIVIDVTGSMRQFVSTMWEWISLNHEKKNMISTYVFFNDGDLKRVFEKVIGSTGGIYATSSRNLAVVQDVMETAMNNGNGGEDSSENDIEALLYGIEYCSTCQNVVYFPDNTATPRDLILLPNVTLPVKVIPCRVKQNKNINPKLLNIAYKTGGSVHTIDEDITNLSSIAIGKTIDIGEHSYRRTEDGFILA